MQDYSQLLAGLEVGGGVNAIVGGGVLILGVGFALWLTDMIATWFDGEDDDDEEENVSWIVATSEGAECCNCGWGAFADDEDGDHGLYAASGMCPRCGES